MKYTKPFDSLRNYRISGSSSEPFDSVRNYRWFRNEYGTISLRNYRRFRNEEICETYEVLSEDTELSVGFGMYTVY